MFKTENEPLALLLELRPKQAKKRFREEIYKAWNYKCGYCNDNATSLDHIIPKFKSGSSNRGNLIPCCRTCNASKASSPMEEWYRQQEFFSQKKLDAVHEWTKGDKIVFTSDISQLRLGIA
jgi:5-methylcytosine-specific restriction endonuclease McrA